MEAREIAAVGIDTASIDHGPSTRFQSHRILFAANVPAFENLANLDRLPPSGAFVIALPMKIAGGSAIITGGVTVASIGMVSGIMVLELFVAFLQAYIFAMLTSVFIGLIQHAH